MTGTLLVIGAARSGMAAARLARSEGRQVLLHDDAPLDETRRKLVEEMGAGLHTGGLPGSEISELVLSPVIRLDHPLVLQAQNKGIPIQSEVEFARKRFRGRVLGVTGSNGKTTTTLLAEAALRAGSFRVTACGNIGLPFSQVVLEDPDLDWVALELSSYQLEHSQNLDLDLAILLNLSVDHLDRHGTLEGYLAAKLRIAKQRKANAPLICGGDDTRLRLALQGCQEPVCFFGSGKEAHVRVLEQGIHFHQDEDYWIHSGQPALPGQHNLENIAAVAMASRKLELPEEAVRKALLELPPVEHRIEPVLERRGIRWVNDSKGTNPDATARALASMPSKRVLLLAGGLSKTRDYGPIRDLLLDRVRHLFCFGKDGASIADYFRGQLPVERCDTLAECVMKARRLAGEGDVILLSPMCSSFDQFDSYEERGRAFKDLARELPEDSST